MTDLQILKTAQKILPHLDELLGTQAPAVKRELQRLLAQAEKGEQGIPQKILDLLDSFPATSQWLRYAEAQKKQRVVDPGVPVMLPAGLPSKGATPPEIRPPGQHAKPPAPAPPALKVAPQPQDGDVAFGDLDVVRFQYTPLDAGGETRSARLPYDVVTIHFATDRETSGITEPTQFFTGDRANTEQVTYGTCDVSIPPGHQKGHLESPSWLKFEVRTDPKKHVALLKVSPLDPASFFASASQGGPQALVFVHGFRVTFEDGARRMAQIARDLHPFVALPILYSWPSRGKMASLRRGSRSRGMDCAPPAAVPGGSGDKVRH